MCHINLKFKIISFTVSTVDKNGKFIENKSTSGRFSEAQIEQIRKLKSGDKIYFENIVARDPYGTNRKLGILMFRIE